MFFSEATLLALDPRVKILVAVTLGVLAWKTGLLGLIFYIIGLSALCWQLRATLPGQRQVLKSYGWFLLFWTVAKVGLELWDGTSMSVAAVEAGVLALRLTCLLLVGLVLALATSPRQLGMALTWFLRPVLGNRAWKGALALSLMVHFLPITWLTLAQVRQATLRRCAHLNLFKRMLIVGQSTLRNLGQKTWNQALAVACRGLYKPQAWQPVFRAGVVQWCCGVGFVAVAAALSFV